MCLCSVRLLVIESSEGTKLADTSKYVNLFSGPDMGDFIHFHLLNILDCHYLYAGKWQFNKCGKGVKYLKALTSKDIQSTNC